MPSSKPPPTHDSKPQSEPVHDPKPPAETQAKVEESSDPAAENQPGNQPEDLEVKKDDAVPKGEVEEEEEGECGFCLFMKGGGCREVFIEWEKCVEEGEEKNEDIVEKCFEITGNLKKCMEAHSDYYGPLLQAEKAAQEEAMKELEKEKEIEKGIEGSTKVAENSDKDSVLGVSEQKIEEKDGIVGISEQKSEEKDGVLNGSEEKKEKGS